jgi:hypothetical protein
MGGSPRSPLRGLFHQGFHDDDRPPQGFPYGQPSAGLDRASFSKGLDTAEHYAACRCGVTEYAPASPSFSGSSDFSGV